MVCGRLSEAEGGAVWYNAFVIGENSLAEGALWTKRSGLIRSRARFGLIWK